MNVISEARNKIKDVCKIRNEEIDYREYLSVCSRLLKIDTELNYLCSINLPVSEIEEAAAPLIEESEQLISKIT